MALCLESLHVDADGSLYNNSINSNNQQRKKNERKSK